MIKALTSLAAFAAAATLAQAQPLPAPPTVKYTPPATVSCDAQSFQIYFSQGDAQLTSESLNVLEAAREELSGCIVGPVSLRAEVNDAVSANEAELLAEARLEAVSSALASHELSGTRLHARVEADRAAFMTEPMGRAVQVKLSAWAPQIG